MAILRKKRTTNFSVVDNRILNDKRLSFKARGLLIYMLSMPDDWKFYVSELTNHSENDGEKAIRSALNELKKYKYLTIKQRREENGLFGGQDWIVSDTPSISRDTEKRDTEKRDAEKRDAEKRDTEKRDTENGRLLNTNNTKYLNILNTNLNTTTTNLYISRVKNQDMIQYLNSVDDELVEWITNETEKAPQPSQRYFESIVKRLMSINAMTVEDATKQDENPIPKIELIKLAD